MGGNRSNLGNNEAVIKTVRVERSRWLQEVIGRVKLPNLVTACAAMRLRH